MNSVILCKKAIIIEASPIDDELVELCVDICRRNGKRKLVWLVDKNKTMSYTPDDDEFLIWDKDKRVLGNFVAKVNAELDDGSYYRVRLSRDDAKSQIGAFRDLSKAKEYAKNNPGYSVFRANHC